MYWYHFRCLLLVLEGPFHYANTAHQDLSNLAHSSALAILRLDDDLTVREGLADGHDRKLFDGYDYVNLEIMM